MCLKVINYVSVFLEIHKTQIVTTHIKTYFSCKYLEIAPNKTGKDGFISFYFLPPSLRLLSTRILFVDCYLTVVKICYFFVHIINFCILLPFGVAFLFAGVHPLIILSEKLKNIKIF